MERTEEISQTLKLAEKSDRACAPEPEEPAPSDQSEAGEVENIAAGLNRFPDIKLPGVKTEVDPKAKSGTPGRLPPSAACDRSFAHLLSFWSTLTHRKRTIGWLSSLVALLAIGAWFIDRCNTEKAYRHYVDQAQVAKLENQQLHANLAWSKALEEATKLGDNPKTLGDIYMELAKTAVDRGIAQGASVKPASLESVPTDLIMLDSTQDIRRAIQLYRMVPNTVLPQIEANKLLLERLPIPVYERDFDVTENHHLARDFPKALEQQKKNLGVQSLSVYSKLMKILPQGRGPDNRLKVNASLRTLQDSQLTPEEVTPLISAVAYFEFESDFESKIAQNKRLEAILQASCARTGHSSHDYQYMIDLANKEFAKKDFLSAYYLLWKCQGIRDSAQTREKIRRCYLELCPITLNEEKETFRVLDELLRLHASAFGMKNHKITDVLRFRAVACTKTGRFDEAEGIRKEIISRVAVDPLSEIPFEGGYMPIDYSVKQTTECDLLKLYIVAGKFKEAREFYKSLCQRNTHTSELDEEFLKLCVKASWLNDPLLKEAIHRQNGNEY